MELHAMMDFFVQTMMYAQMEYVEEQLTCALLFPLVQLLVFVSQVMG
jgi:hypothetical protein